jgi:hypothetical protein
VLRHSNTYYILKHCFGKKPASPYSGLKEIYPEMLNLFFPPLRGINKVPVIFHQATYSFLKGRNLSFKL